MNINKRKRSSASARASQAICGQPFCPFINGFRSKICSSKCICNGVRWNKSLCRFLTFYFTIMYKIKQKKITKKINVQQKRSPKH